MEGTQESPPAAESGNNAATGVWGGLKLRIISGVCLAAFAWGMLYTGGWLFQCFVFAAALQMSREWEGLAKGNPMLHRMLGLVYVAVPCASLVWLRGLYLPKAPDAGYEMVLYLILVVCATDIGAYFAGRRIGGPKLAPRISPNKTWAGLGGGVVSAAVMGGICASFTAYPPSLIACMDLAALLALVSQGGDLFESWMKRRAGVKDSGALIPGHGGLLDRVDGLVFALPVFALFAAAHGSGA